MPRRAPLLAAAALGLGTVGAVAVPIGSASAATPGSIRITAPCEGGPGTLVLTAGTSGTGSAAHVRLSGLSRKKWSGETAIGRSAYDQDPSVQDDPTLTAVDGVLTDSASTKQSWPRPIMAGYVSADYQILCAAGFDQTSKRTLVSGGDDGVMITPARRTVRIGADAPKGSRWKVVVTVTTSKGTQHLTRRLRAGKGDDIDTRFKQVRHLATLTRVSFKATNLKTGAVRKLVFSRSR